MALRCSVPASSSSVTAPQPATASRWLSAAVLPASCFRRLSVPAVPPWHPRPAASSRWLFAAAPLPATPLSRRLSQQHLCHGASASSIFPKALHCSAPASSNSVRAPQPAASSRCCRIVFHAGSPAERQLFRTDFRFAPSPRRASLAGPPIHEDMVVHGLCGRVPDSAGNACSLNCCCSDRRKSFGPSAPIAYATSVSPPDEAIAWPGCRCWVQDEAVASQGAGVGWQMMLLVVRGRVPANHRAHFKT